MLPLLGLISCEKQQNPVEMEYIAMNGRESSVVDIFDSIEVIALETSDSSLIGLRITKMEYFDGKLYILNQLTSGKNVLCFNESGDFLYRVGQLGKGPGEYMYIEDIMIDPTRSRIILTSDWGKWLYYDIKNGGFINDNKFEVFYNRQYFYLTDSQYIAYHDPEEPPLKIIFLEYNSNTMQVSQLSSSLSEPLGYLGNSPLAVHNKKAYYCSIQDTIYNITNIQNPNPCFYIDWGKDIGKIKKSLFATNKSNKEVILRKFNDQFFKKAKLKIIGSWYIGTKWIVFNILQSQSDHNMQDLRTSILFYNKETKKSYSSEKMDFYDLNFSNNTQVVGMSDEAVYLLLNNRYFEQDHRKAIKESSFSKENKEILLQQTEECNPLIIKIKL